jgi:hypothetical protein
MYKDGFGGTSRKLYKKVFGRSERGRQAHQGNAKKPKILTFSLGTKYMEITE